MSIEIERAIKRVRDLKELQKKIHLGKAGVGSSDYELGKLDAMREILGILYKEDFTKTQEDQEGGSGEVLGRGPTDAGKIVEDMLNNGDDLYYVMDIMTEDHGLIRTWIIIDDPPRRLDLDKEGMERAEKRAEETK